MKKTLRHIICIILTVIPLLSCEQDDIVNPVDFVVVPDSGNTYVAGEPVRFNISGDADFIVFYSGEETHEYRYRDRNAIPVEDIDSLVLDMSCLATWGVGGGLDFYVSNSFEGLKGDDGEADRKTIREMYEGGMQGWTKLEYAEGASAATTYHHYDMSEYAGNLSLAMHWHPDTHGFDYAQRSYQINGNFLMRGKNVRDYVTSLRELPYVSVVMNEEEKDPYLHDHRGDTTGIATVCFEDLRFDIWLQGCSRFFLDYELDWWVISNPVPVNNVQADTGIQVKNMTNILQSFEYVFEKPGTYNVVFLGTNSNFQGSTYQTKELTVNIIPPPLHYRQ